MTKLNPEGHSSVPSVTRQRPPSFSPGGRRIYEKSRYIPRNPTYKRGKKSRHWEDRHTARSSESTSLSPVLLYDGEKVVEWGATPPSPTFR